MTIDSGPDATPGKTPIIVIYVAIAQNGVIGRDGGMPWRLSTDLKRFKASTMGKPIIMGRKTWESFPKRPLPGRQNIVITRDRTYEAEGADVAASLDQAIAMAGPAEEICIIGGGEIYAQAMPLADQLDVTHVLGDLEGDTHFPAIDPNEWTIDSEDKFPAGERDSHSTRHTVYSRRRA